MSPKHVGFLVLGLAIGLLVGFGWPHVKQRASQMQPDHIEQADDGHAHAAEDPAAPRSGSGQDEHLPSDEMHEHGEENAGEEHDEPEDHTAVHLNAEAVEQLGIELATAGPGSLTREIERPGEVVLNENRVAHIVPQAPGIVREVVKNVGDPVEAGEVLAWLESAELGQAKADYLAKWAEAGCCTVDLSRAREIHDSTLRLLEVLESSPALETLQQTNESTTGDNGRVLISAYAELELTRATYVRERALFEKGVSSERDYQAAESAYQKAAAEYAATRDSIQFAIQRDLLEATRTRQVRQIDLTSAERRLHVLGLDDGGIKELESLAQTGAADTATQPTCNDPNCKGCAHHATAGQQVGSTVPRKGDEKLAWYPLRAPFDGTVIQKHITLGERLGDDANPFTIADLSLVWVDLSIYQSDLPYVQKGQKVFISAGPDIPEADGTIAFVAPVIGEDTRTVCARVVLPNPNGRWRPGLYVTAGISTDQQTIPVLIPTEAVQAIDDESIVFVPTEEGFEPLLVSVGRSNSTHAEITAGLSPGDRYVLRGAFALKAEIITSGLGSHAGHGH